MDKTKPRGCFAVSEKITSRELTEAGRLHQYLIKQSLLHDVQYAHKLCNVVCTRSVRPSPTETLGTDQTRANESSVSLDIHLVLIEGVGGAEV